MKLSVEPIAVEAASPPARRRLWQAFVRSVRDNLLAEVGVQILRIGGVVILARALRPDDFGLLKILVVASILAILVCEGGIADAFIQREALRDDHEATAWWLTIALSIVAGISLWTAAPVASRLMAMPRLSPSIRLICLPILLEGSAIMGNARLRRELRFGAVALADVIAEAVFLATALLLLANGMTKWSLPGAMAARLTAHALTIWVADPRIPSGMPRLRAAREMARFSLGAFGGRLMTALSANTDYLLVGGLLGGVALGFYSMAWDLLRFVPDRLHRVAGRVTLPAFCRLQDNDSELGHAYSNFVDYIGRAVLPILACAALAAPEVIGSVYGHRWLPAAGPMRLLALGLILVGLRIGIGSVFYTKNFPSLDIYLNGTRLALLVVAVYVAAPWGLLAVSAAVSIVEAVIGIAGQYLVCVLINLDVLVLLRAVVPGARVAFWCLLGTAAGKLIGREFDLQPPLVLLPVVGGAAIAFVWGQAGNLMDILSRGVAREGAAAFKASQQES